MTELLKNKSHIIVEGWMAGIMARELPKVLRILLICDDKVRLKRCSLREVVSLAEAEKKIKDREGNLLKKLKEIYKRDDLLDPKNYNLIVDTTKKTPKETLSFVLKVLKKNKSVQ